jgi:hypothetical protein
MFWHRRGYVRVMPRSQLRQVDTQPGSTCRLELVLETDYRVPGRWYGFLC